MQGIPEKDQSDFIYMKSVSTSNTMKVDSKQSLNYANLQSYESGYKILFHESKLTENNVSFIVNEIHASMQDLITEVTLIYNSFDTYACSFYISTNLLN